jgi:DNA-binding NtrC family response regulator
MSAMGSRCTQGLLEFVALTITRDNQFANLLRRQLRRAGGGRRVIVAATIEKACSLLRTARPQVVVVHWAHDHTHYQQLDRLLWTTTVLARRIPVLIIAERYYTHQATMFFRMGVFEYVSCTHHRDRLGPLVRRAGGF